MQYHLKKAIENRYDKKLEGYVNLTLFHKEPGLYNILYCPLSRPRFLLYVLSILRRIITVTSLNLSDNSIENLKPLEVLQEFENLHSLNLSNNKVSDPEFIKLIGAVAPSLEEINLHKNPICEKFEIELEYVKWIRNNIPSIKVIDGISINFGIPNQQVWMCCKESSFIVDEFIAHYFTLYDRDRNVLKFTYDKDALFSLTCDNSSAQNLKASGLVNQSKIPPKKNEKNKILSVTFHKNNQIVDSLCTLPTSKHDLHSFKVDVLHFEEAFLILVVSGVFQEFQDIPKSRHFYRTFILKNVSKDEYKITNDIYYITDASEEEVKNSFICCVHHSSKIPKRYVNEKEEENMIKVIMKLTEMNHAYSKKCLQDCDWNVKKALKIFIENYQNYNIPPEAFMD